MKNTFLAVAAIAACASAFAETISLKSPDGRNEITLATEPALAIPVSRGGTFAMMYAAGFTINNLTLFGLVLAIGIVVDDAIVVVENVERNMAECPELISGITSRIRDVQRLYDNTLQEILDLQ